MKMYITVKEQFFLALFSARSACPFRVLARGSGPRPLSYRPSASLDEEPVLFADGLPAYRLAPFGLPRLPLLPNLLGVASSQEAAAASALRAEIQEQPAARFLQIDQPWLAAEVAPVQARQRLETGPLGYSLTLRYPSVAQHWSSR